MKSKKLLLTALVALAVPFGTLSGGFVKAEGPSKASEDAHSDAWENAANENIKPVTQPGVTPQDHPTNTPTAKESRDAENKYLDDAAKKYEELTATHTNGDALINHKPEYKLPDATQTPKKQLKQMDKNVKKVLPKASAVK